MEKNAECLVGLLFLLFGVTVFTPSDSFGQQEKKGIRMERASEKVWKTFKTPGSFLAEDIDACRADAECLVQVAEIWRKAVDSDKLLAMGKFRVIGCQIHPSVGGKPRRYGPYLVEGSLIEVVVEALSNDNPELRSLACRILARETPDSLVRDHSDAIASALSKHPETKDGARLLGKLANNRALKLLESKKAFQDDDSLAIASVYGKLGDHGRESSLVDSYQTSVDPSKKKVLALRLGYMAQPKSILALAQDLRSPLQYAWNQRARRSFRLHVIEALSLAYPMEPLLWKPSSNPTNDEYYAEIEAWAQRAIGVEWKNPRPPFLYEEQAPMAKPGIGR